MAKDDAEIKELTKKLAQNPDSMVFVQLADALRRAGDLEQSIAVCLKGLTKHSGYVTARVVLGRTYMDAGRLDDAVEEFLRIEAAEPENVMAHRMLGEIYLKKGRFGDAVARQQKVLSIDPEDSTAQELLQEALALAKTQEGSKAHSPVKPAPPKAGGHDQHGNLKVADIYIKKGAWDEAAEVLQEILSSDPANAVARQRLGEVQASMGNSPRYAEAVAKVEDHKRKAEEETRVKAEAEAKKKAEEDAKKKAEADAEAKRKADEEAKKKAAEEEVRKKAEAEARRKADAETEAKRKAEEEAKRKADEEAKKKAAEEEARKKAEAEAKKKADEEAKRKAEEEAKKKAAEEEARKKAEAEAKKKAEEEAKRKAEEEAKKKAAEEESRKKAEAEAKKKAEEEAKHKAEEEAKKKAEEEARKKAEALTAKAILSVMTPGSDDLVEDDSAKGSAPAASAPGLAGDAKALIEAFVKAQGIESFLLLGPKGEILQQQVAGDVKALAVVADAIFRSTEKAAARMGLGGLKQINIVGEDGRQILSVSLKSGVFVGLTGKNTNLGLLRVAVNDLAKKA